MNAARAVQDGIQAAVCALRYVYAVNAGFLGNSGNYLCFLYGKAAWQILVCGQAQLYRERSAALFSDILNDLNHEAAAVLNGAAVFVAAVV